jgi:hypothetical protein
MTLSIRLRRRDARTILFILLGVEAVLAIAYLEAHVIDVGLPWGPFRAWINLDGDVSLPAWFSAMQLFAVGALWGMAAYVNRHREQVSSAFLAAVGMGFVFLSADEGSMIHERITLAAKMLGADALLIRGHGAWISIYGTAAVGALLLAGRHLRRLWAHNARPVLLGGLGAAVYVGGAVGVEVLGYLVLGHGAAPRLAAVQVLVEESLEMVGVSLILYGTLLLLRSVGGRGPSGASGSGETKGRARTRPAAPWRTGRSDRLQA